MKENTNINIYRNLVILAINKLIEDDHISLNRGDIKNGHIMAKLAGEKSAIIWSDVGHDEIRVTVWWKYDHNKHPLTKYSGNSREEFCTTQPLAKKNQYQNFVGVTCSGWLERKTTKCLQGYGKDYLRDIYTRRGEKKNLELIHKMKPNGYDPEGKFSL